MIFNIKTLLVGMLLILMFASCEDVIELDVDEGEKLVVVDAWLNTEGTSQSLTLTETQNYFDSSTPTGVTGATVILSNTTTNETFVFAEGLNGEYVWGGSDNPDVIGSVGDELRLDISYDGDNYTSTTSVGRVPQIDEIRQELQENELGFEDGIYAEFIARDLVGVGDTYWIKTYKNDTFLNDPFELNIAYDAGFSDGSSIDGIVFIPPIRRLTNPVYTEEGKAPWEVGDVCRVEIHSISFSAFKFMELARDQMLNGFNGIFAEPLANSKGNIINTTGTKEALGVFTVSAISSLEKTIE